MFEVYTDGASTGSPGWAGAGVFVKDGNHVERHSFPLGMKDTHEAEFIAVIKALRLLKDKQAATVSLRSDSQTVVQSIEKEYIHKEAYKPLLDEILKLSKEFPLFFVKWIPSKENRADSLAREGIQKNEGKQNE
ncbi:ribonuclease HI family protein [Bacillus thermotolerans]|uniref:Ribonuclease HI n=1 Tax=Bacillus thermotolerans TaxID=1221996 RepID=A0A0F5HXX1_BACTR|nr:ribonuclease HI family protein [Bacillus thermotolerans]KKB37697.1 Ribonuclease HI [Bacillus thermotolerans]KKB38511.1 Ribonuclease HI [Bacillus thermotolerans]KKB39927.1 Ribonuclease HI [Bacillus thermotolerans]